MASCLTHKCSNSLIRYSCEYCHYSSLGVYKLMLSLKYFSWNSLLDSNTVFLTLEIIHLLLWSMFLGHTRRISGLNYVALWKICAFNICLWVGFLIVIFSQGTPKSAFSLLYPTAEGFVACTQASPLPPPISLVLVWESSVWLSHPSPSSSAISTLMVCCHKSRNLLSSWLHSARLHQPISCLPRCNVDFLLPSTYPPALPVMRSCVYL